jgi:hypothetical protein
MLERGAVASVKDLLRYDKMVETALRGVVREALARTMASGLPGTHHFYITFKTHYPGVKVADSLLADYPEEMTIVLEHQFWELEVAEERFAVTLSFKGRPERVDVPFEAVTSFTDPSVKFGLQFQPSDSTATPSPPAPSGKPTDDKKKGDKSAKTSAEVVTLDSFRKK